VHRTHPSVRRRAMLALLAACALAAGCNIVAPIALLVHGPPKVPREHELDRRRTVAVFLDDPASVVPSMGYRRALVTVAQERIARRAKVAEVVDARESMAILQRDSARRRMSIVEIGRSIGAAQVVWARVEGFSLAAPTGEFRPNAQLRVKVIDAENNARLWPQTEQGHRLEVTMPVRAGFVPTSGNEQRQAMEELAEYAGRALAELFYREERARSARAGN